MNALRLMLILISFFIIGILFDPLFIPLSAVLAVLTLEILDLVYTRGGKKDERR